nr:hypothetical protein [uncultured Flavobacterium sp.]
MKTTKKLSFPKLENEFLENILRQLVNQYTVIQLFFTKQKLSIHSYLVINLEKKIDADQLQSAKWVEKARNSYQINIIFIYSGRLHHRFSLGHPFIELYCQPSALIYQNEDTLNSLIITRNWKKYKQQFHAFEERFYNDHDLHKVQVHNLISEGASNSVFTSYARWMEYDLEYLEELYLVNTFNSLSLAERIHNLTAYIPEIQKYFVRNSHSSYYLIDLFVKAKEASVNDNEPIHKDEMYKAVGIAEQNLYRLIEYRLEELKKRIKKASSEKQEVSIQMIEKPIDVILDIAIETIAKSAGVEEMYLFHQITYGEKTTYYLMLIAMGAGNEKLKSITQSLKSRTGGKYDFVLISHNRSWIQKNLYQFQSFFTAIIQDKNLIYASSPYHPQLHWEVPHDPYHGDLYFYYMSAKNSALQFFTIARNVSENRQGLEYLFSLFFLSFCRTYIFIKTYYLPNYLSSQALWELCIYADPGIRKYNYLTEQFWTDFFLYLDKHRTLHQRLSTLKKEEADQMNVIVEKLAYELYDLVIEGGLLNFEGD